MQSLRLARSVGLFSILTFVAVSFATGASAQPPVVRTKPVIDQQLQAQAHRAKQHGRAQHDHPHHKTEHAAPKK